MVSRRDFLAGAAVGIAFGGLLSYIYVSRKKAQISRPTAEGYGALRSDPEGILDLPQGFSYEILSRAGEEMADGLLVPGRPDAMACFPHQPGRVVLTCNHELGDWPSAREVSPFGPGDERFSRIPLEKVYDPGEEEARAIGGVRNIVYDLRERRVVTQFLSLAGTYVNCAGGPTPRNTWLTCEEFFDGPRGAMQKRHGYVFEVPATAAPSLADPVPLKDMGRFVHEAAVTDPETGIVYLTEDAWAGVFYRFIPNQPDNLRGGGTLQALALADHPSAIVSNRRHSRLQISERTALPVRWITLEDVDPEDNDLASRAFDAGAAQFERSEGMWFGERELYFAATSGGPDRKGQIWRYRPDAKEIELFLQPSEASNMENPDNILVAPWGDLIFCEDGPMPNFLRAITPDGKIYDIGRNDYEGAEFAGACFSPDGSTLFVNLQDRHLTLAIRGPWERRRV